MYGKIFDSIYDGTLAENWEALITFQQFIVLCDADGTVDMTPFAISRRTGIPIEHINAGIEALERPDPSSRTNEEEGRRIARLDDHRPWGWFIVNHSKYKSIKDAGTVRAQNRERKRKQRARQKENVSDEKQSRTQSHQSQKSRTQSHHTDTDIDTKDKTLMSGKEAKALLPDVSVSTSLKQKNLKKEARAVLDFLNEKCGRKYRPVKANLSIIEARLKERGGDVTSLYQVIAKKRREWINDEKMNEYLRPATLINATKFANYEGELQ